MAQPAAPRLGSFYANGPALGIGGPVQTQESQVGAGEPAVQAKCARCEAEEAAAEGTTVQAKCAQCEAEAASAEEAPVQLWDCDEYGQPTCVQTQAEPAEPPLQAKCADCEATEPVQQAGTPSDRPQRIRRAARDGLKSAGQPLPHGDRIQAAFGRHDVSRVRANVGGDAATANRRMGALAFTSGNRIGFRQTPSLRLAAHEAAHVVQQREGLSLPDNVGRPGDRWERHADRVAESVVAGRSAEPLLDEVATPDATSTGAGPSDGQAISTTSVPAVQQQIGAITARLFESSPQTLETVEAPPDNADTGADTCRQAAQQDSTDKSPKHQAIDDEDSEASPDALAVGSAAALVGTSAAVGEAAESAPIDPSKGACYDVDPPPVPEDALEPESDEKGTDSKAELQVEFEAWTDEKDECDLEKSPAENTQQLPAGLGTGSATAAVGGADAGAASTAGAAATAGSEGGTASANSDVQAMSTPAVAEVDQSMAAAGEMDGQISAAQRDRDAAVENHEAAMPDLRRVTTRARSLDQGVTFQPSRSARSLETRTTVIDLVSDFMTRVADQITDAVDFAQHDVPTLLHALADDQQARVQSAIETEKAAIFGRITTASAQARAQAATARAHIWDRYRTSAAAIRESTATAMDELESEYDTSMERVEEKETRGLDDVNSRFAAGRKRHEEKGPEYAARAITRGQEHADGYEHCKGEYRDDGFWDGCLTVRRARAQQDAACKTAAGYKDAFLSTANKKGHDLKELRKGYRCAVIQGASQVKKTLDDTYEQLVTGLELDCKNGLKGITRTRDENLAAIDNALSTTLKSLAGQGHAQRQAVNDVGYLKQLAVQQLANSGAAGLARGISTATRSLEGTLSMLREQLAGSEVPEPEQLAENLAGTEASLGGGMGMLLDKMQEGLEQAAAGVTDMGAAAREGLLGLTTQNDELSSQVESGFAEQMDGLKTAATQALGQLTGDHVKKAKKTSTEGTASMREAAKGFDTALATLGGKIEEAITASLQELDKELGDKLAELDEQIVTEAWKAAKKEQPAWKSVVAIILVIVVIIAATLISIATLGGGAALFATILVGALVGAVSGGLIQLINNWASGEDWDEGLIEAVVMGAIGGAIGGGFGFAGGAIAAGAGGAGARVVTQAAITVGTDLLAEGVTQLIGLVAYGRDFNWQGFVTAGMLSGVSFRAAPKTRPRAGAPDVKAPKVSGSRHGITQIAGGAAVGFTTEALIAWIGGEDFDLMKALSSAASAGAGRWKSRQGAASGPKQKPNTRLRRGLESFRSFDPGGVGASIKGKLEGFGASRFGQKSDVDGAGGLPPGRIEDAGQPFDKSGRRARPETDSDAPAGKPRSDLDPLAPASRMSDAEMAEISASQARVGDTSHEVSVRRRGQEVECEVCSRACDAVRKKIGAIVDELDKIPTSSSKAEELRQQLAQLIKDVDGIEHQIDGTLHDKTRFEVAGEVVDLAGKVAGKLQDLGVDVKSLGKAIDDPTLLDRSELFPLSGKSDQPVNVGKLKGHANALDLELAKTFQLKEFDQAVKLLKKDQEAIYVLRNVDGTILKVGKTSESNIGKRFNKYRRAGENLNMDLTLEVTPVKLSDSGESMVSAVDIETALRGGLEAEGHLMPWDNTNRRLDRPGPGAPFEPPRGKNSRSMDQQKEAASHQWIDEGHLEPLDLSTVPTVIKPKRPRLERIEQLLKEKKGNIKNIANALTIEQKTTEAIDPNTVRGWIHHYGFKARDYQK